MNRAAAAMMLLLPACAPKSCSPEKRVTQLVFGTTTEPASIDPAFASDAASQELARLAYLELTEHDDAWRVVPRLAAAIPEAETSTSGMSVRWRLRPGYGWSDGAAITGADVVFAHGIEADDQLDTPNHEVARRASIRAGEGGFEVTWDEPFADYAAPKVHAVLPAHAYPKPTGAAFAGVARTSAPASGPYRLTKWVPGQHAIFEPNPHFGGTRPTIERIVYRFFPSEDALEAELVAGGVDAVGEASGLGLERVQNLASQLEPTHVVEYADSGLMLHLSPNLAHPLLARIEVRRAIFAAMDREALCALVYGPRARPATGFYPPRHPGHVEAAFSPEAPSLASLVDGADPIRLEYMSGSQASARAAAFVADALKKAGLATELSAAPPAVVMKHLRESPAPLTLLAFRWRPDWDGASALTKGGTRNFTGYADPEVAESLTRAQTTVDPTAWGDRLRTVERLFRRDLPLIPLAYRPAVSVRPKRLKGWRPTGTTTPVTWNAETWRLTSD
ncbi:MAG: ABC transporter substrate-binding protein [Deltaproteobacteria bacterium]